MPNTDFSLLRQLSKNSSRYRDPLAAIDWAGLDCDSFWLPEPALSLYGLPEYATLAVEVRQRLSQYELINVMCCGLWLESVFLQRLSDKLGPRLPRTDYEYFLHEIREEAGHSLMFLKAIDTSGLALPPDAWRAPGFACFLVNRMPASGALFWLATVIAEDVPDKFNRYVRRNADVVNPVVKQICSLHIVDEARHIALARSRVEQVLRDTGAWRKSLLTPVVNFLLRQLVDTFYVPPASFYELAGLTHGAWWRRMARGNAVHGEFVAQCLAPTLRMLEGYGLRPKI